MHQDKFSHAHEAVNKNDGAPNGGEAHTHDSGETHTHEHIHTHIHEHIHDEGHAHEHVKSGDETPGMSKNKLKAILSFMRDHNREHANELHGLLGVIQELDADEVLDLIENGAKSIELAAEQIEQAIELIEEL
jgi:hypothetical protein